MAGDSDGATRSVALFLDPGAQFSRLIPELRAELETRACGLTVLTRLDDQFATMMELGRREAGQQSTVVYVPHTGPEGLLPRPNGLAPALWALVDYRYKGVVWTG